MAQDRLVLHVAPNGDDGWKVEQVDGGFSAGARTKQDAVNLAKEYARDREPSQVRVHRSTGEFDYESTYGDDPAEKEG